MDRISEEKKYAQEVASRLKTFTSSRVSDEKAKELAEVGFCHENGVIQCPDCRLILSDADLKKGRYSTEHGTRSRDCSFLPLYQRHLEFKKKEKKRISMKKKRWWKGASRSKATEDGSEIRPLNESQMSSSLSCLPGPVNDTPAGSSMSAILSRKSLFGTIKSALVSQQTLRSGSKTRASFESDSTHELSSSVRVHESSRTISRSTTADSSSDQLVTVQEIKPQKSLRSASKSRASFASSSTREVFSSGRIHESLKTTSRSTTADSASDQLVTIQQIKSTLVPQKSLRSASKTISRSTTADSSSDQLVTVQEIKSALVPQKSLRSASKPRASFKSGSIREASSSGRIHESSKTISRSTTAELASDQPVTVQEVLVEESTTLISSIVQPVFQDDFHDDIPEVEAPIETAVANRGDQAVSDLSFLLSRRINTPETEDVNPESLIDEAIDYIDDEEQRDDLVLTAASTLSFQCPPVQNIERLSFWYSDSATPGLLADDEEIEDALNFFETTVCGLSLDDECRSRLTSFSFSPDNPMVREDARIESLGLSAIEVAAAQSGLYRNPCDGQGVVRCAFCCSRTTLESSSVQDIMNRSVHQESCPIRESSPGDNVPLVECMGPTPMPPIGWFRSTSMPDMSHTRPATNIAHFVNTARRRDQSHEEERLNEEHINNYNRNISEVTSSGISMANGSHLSVFRSDSAVERLSNEVVQLRHELVQLQERNEAFQQQTQWSLNSILALLRPGDTSV